MHAEQDEPNKGDREDKTLFLVAGLVLTRRARVALNTILYNPRARLKDAQESIA